MNTQTCIEKGVLKEVNRNLFQTLIDSYESFSINIENGLVISVSSSTTDTNKIMYNISITNAVKTTEAFKYTDNLDRNTVIDLLVTLSKFKYYSSKE